MSQSVAIAGIQEWSGERTDDYSQKKFDYYNVNKINVLY